MKPPDPVIEKACSLYKKELICGLAELERVLSKVEISPVELEVVRNFLHRTKGGAGFFGFQEVEDLSSDFESEVLRQKKSGQIDRDILSHYLARLTAINLNPKE